MRSCWIAYRAEKAWMLRPCQQLIWLNPIFQPRWSNRTFQIYLTSRPGLDKRFTAERCGSDQAGSSRPFTAIRTSESTARARL